MEAETLNCPMCGASASTAATQCKHCGARLATVACPSCFSLMFVGEKFCSHCGAKAERSELATAPALLCPRCLAEMNAVAIGNASLRECPRCAGIWVDVRTLEQICADREKQAALLGTAAPLPTPQPGNLETNIRYVPCPVCKQLMNRVNFANCSHVVVDVCKGHGTWFDRDELRRIVEFIRAGGLATARAREMAELEVRRRRLNQAQSAAPVDPGLSPRQSNYAEWAGAISAAAVLLRTLLR